MIIQVGRWGNSLGIRIPLALAKDLGLQEGSELDLASSQGTLIMRPMKTVRKRYTLAELLEGITPETLHPETDWGTPEGKESW